MILVTILIGSALGSSYLIYKEIEAAKKGVRDAEAAVKEAKAVIEQLRKGY